MKLYKEPVYTLEMTELEVHDLWDIMIKLEENGDKRAVKFTDILINYAGRKY